jgi:hypothetical protein
MKIGNMGYGELLRRCCADDKAAVRKAMLMYQIGNISLW